MGGLTQFWAFWSTNHCESGLCLAGYLSEVRPTTPSVSPLGSFFFFFLKISLFSFLLFPICFRILIFRFIRFLFGVESCNFPG